MYDSFGDEFVEASLKIIKIYMNFIAKEQLVKIERN